MTMVYFDTMQPSIEQTLQEYHKDDSLQNFFR